MWGWFLRWFLPLNFHIYDHLWSFMIYHWLSKRHAFARCVVCSSCSRAGSRGAAAIRRTSWACRDGMDPGDQKMKIWGDYHWYIYIFLIIYIFSLNILYQVMIIYIIYLYIIHIQCEAPVRYVCWFRFAPVTIVISTINHSHWSYKLGDYALVLSK